MSVSLSAVYVCVDDHEAALRFYRDLLGLVVRDDVIGGDGGRRITLVCRRQPDVAIVLAHPQAGGLAPDDALAALLAAGGLGSLRFRCDDLDGAFDRLADPRGSAIGHEVVQEPIARSGGARDAAVLDPAGNLVGLEQP